LQLNKVEHSDLLDRDDLQSELESDAGDSEIFATSYFDVNAQNMQG